MKRAILCSTALITISFAGSAAAQDSTPPGQSAASPTGVKTARLDDVEWRPGPFPGSSIAVLAGDPKQGMHHTYLKLADGAYVAPHWHSTDEYVTVISGTMLLGIGAKAAHDQTRLYGPGAFVFMPAKTPHYVWAKGQAVLSQTRSGPADFHWIDPADDPARQTTDANEAKKQ